jgi:hypothetical protein
MRPIVSGQSPPILLGTLPRKLIQLVTTRRRLEGRSVVA